MIFQFCPKKRTDNAVVVCISFVCTHILYFLRRSFSRKRTSYSLFELICIFLLYSWKELCFLCSWKTTFHNTLFCTENANPSCWIFAITTLKDFFHHHPWNHFYVRHHHHHYLSNFFWNMILVTVKFLIAWIWPGLLAGGRRGCRREIER